MAPANQILPRALRRGAFLPAGMPPAPFRSEFLAASRFLLRWAVRLAPLAGVIGSMTALFLAALDAVTRLRWQHGWLLFFLPPAGVLIHLLYRFWGKSAERGTDLILDEIHAPGGGVPARMAPLVLLTTLLTHLFGGSAGREGTAVQLAGSAAGLWGRWLRLSPEDTRLLLRCGIAGGFGAVFGTPVAGTVFALEVLTVGRVRYEALLPCLLTAVLADAVCAAWGIHHTAYRIAALPGIPAGGFKLHFRLLATVALAGVAFGLAGTLFSRAIHGVRRMANAWIRPSWLVPVAGGSLIVLLALGLHKTDYLGLGVTAPSDGQVSIVHAFRAGGATPASWLWKLLFTALTLGCGFKGGEVTPLFFVGATLGNALAVLSGAPVDLMAGLGFIAVFAGATNTPLACTLMGAELFGGQYVLYYAVACFTAYFFSGSSGIYSAQRRNRSKLGAWRGF